MHMHEAWLSNLFVRLSIVCLSSENKNEIGTIYRVKRLLNPIIALQCVCVPDSNQSAACPALSYG